MDYLILIIGLTLLLVGANVLVDSTVAIAKKAHLSNFIIGFTIIGMGTSSPELFISLSSAITGHGDIALGNVIGSNICNTLLILGATAAILPFTIKREQTLRDIPFAIATSILIAVLAFTGSTNGLSRLDGIILLSIFAAYTLYVISKSLPDWSQVRGFVPIDEPADITGLREKLNKDCAFGFRLFASPTKKVARDGKLSSRVFLKTADERDQWLHRQAQKSGFELISFSEVSETKVAGRKKDMSVNYTGVLFTGVLRIVDPDLLWKAYCQGIGPGKAYGLGMLMIRGL